MGVVAGGGQRAEAELACSTTERYALGQDLSGVGVAQPVA